MLILSQQKSCTENCENDTPRGEMKCSFGVESPDCLWAKSWTRASLFVMDVLDLHQATLKYVTAT